MDKFPPVKYPIVVDKDKMSISVGKAVYKQPMLYRSRESNWVMKCEVLNLNNEDVPRDVWEDLKLRNKYFAQLMGPKFNRRFQAANYHLWIGDKMTQKTGDLLRYEGRNWQQYNPELVVKANRVIEHINQAERDNLYHLIPAIVAFEDSPSNIRALVGRGAWRQIAGNSMTRNAKLMKVVSRFNPGDIKTTATVWMKYMEAPSGILPAIRAVDHYGGHFSGIDVEVLAAKLAPRKTARNYEHTLHIVSDAIRMIGEGRFNFNWSLSRIIEEHDKASKALLLKQHSNVPFTQPWKYEDGGYVGELLTSPLDIALEGQEQRHCVASYSQRAFEGSYEVYRITGKERATAGVLRTTGNNWDPRGFMFLDQVYQARNQPVSEKCRIFVHDLVRARQRHLHRAMAA